jgi:uncharacterized protein YecE (DUF72 family)
MATIRIGCCGFVRSRAEYFAQFDLVEVQQTFYKLPQVETARRWRQEAPPAFEFTMKAWQAITHDPSSPTYRKAGLQLPGPAEHYGFFRPTDEVMTAWERTLEIAGALQASIVVLQCPARFTPTPEHIRNIRQFLERARRPAGLRLAWEPRGEWPREIIAGICREYDVIHAVDPFQGLPAADGTAYFRLHGRTGYRYQYTDEDLEQLAAWCQGFAKAYCMFNNISMWEDALRFRRLTAGDSA